MNQLPPIISDLALILLVAGVVTVIVRKLKQPLVLGYIVAGFLASPHMPYMPSVQDHSNIEVWSEIGVIFLMFVLGLEFSLKKIASMGMRPVVATSLTMLSMIGVGATMGQLMGWSNFDSLFLGGILSISSTTIIYKALDDLGWLSRRFAQEVFSVLILEDIFGILLMILLSTVAATTHAAAGGGSSLLTSLTSLAVFLVLWFVVGIYVVPYFLKKNRKIINSEILLVVSIGLCFGLVVLAAQAGFSAAFGAFVMGSILAETIEAERIEKLVNPVRDLFGAVFFVSVGMLVDPAVLAAYWLPIVLISLALFVGMAFFGTLSFVIAGHPLQRAMQCSFSLTQIGEFSFIIATLGQSLGVTSSHLYPIVVAVSIVTTFLAPYIIRSAQPAYRFIERFLPETWQARIADRPAAEDGALASLAATTSAALTPEGDAVTSLGEAIVAAAPTLSTGKAALTFVRVVFLQTLVYTVLSATVIGLSFSAFLPVLRHIPPTHFVGNALTGLGTIFVISPLLRPIVARKNRSRAAQTLRNSSWGSAFFNIIFFVRWCIATYLVFYVLEYLSPFAWYYHLPLAFGIMILVANSRWVKYRSIKAERRFAHNLRQREVVAQQKSSQEYGFARRLSARDVHFARLVVPPFSQWAGRSLAELDFSSNEGVLVVAIIRQDIRINAPDGHMNIFPGDELEVIGDDTSLDTFAQRMAMEVEYLIEDDGRDHSLQLRRIVASPTSPLLPCTVAESDIRDVHRCMLVGVEDDSGSVELAEASRVLRPHDVLWVVGEERQLRALETSLKGNKNTQPKHSSLSNI